MSAQSDASRRRFLGTVGAGAAAGVFAGVGESTAQSPAPLQIVDFHNHYMGPSWTLTNLAGLPPAARPAWEVINRNLQSPSALLDSIDTAGIAARVINTPTAFIEDADGNVPEGAEQRINDQIAELCAKHRGKLYGLATVDAFNGETAARELTRAVRELGLRGVFVEAAKRDFLLGGKESRPLLTAAAALGVPVFVHPLTDPQLDKRFARIGRIGMRFARGTINSAALISLIESGTFDETPNLRVVVTTLAMGGLFLAGGFGDGARIRSDTPEQLRLHVYVDTMGLNPVQVRAAVDLLGVDHVLVGTDWPIVVEASVPGRLQKALAHSGLNAGEQQLVASGNALKLLGVA